MKASVQTALGMLASGLIGAGCRTMPAPTTRPTTQSIAENYTPLQMTITAQPQPSGDPRDPHPRLAAIVHLDIYLLDMPAGLISDNSEFWRRVDEQAVGAANADRLNRNGIRCGVVPRSEAPFFGRFFGSHPHPATRLSRMDAVHTDHMELEMEKKFDQEDLFFFNSSDQLEGRTYEQATNQLLLTFGPTPRDPNAVQITLCPEIYNDKSQIRFSPLNQEYQTPVKDVDRLFELGLSADVPGDGFMIIAPGPDASRPASIGGRFLIKQDKTGKFEQVIVIIPALLRLDGKPAVVREGFLK